MRLLMVAATVAVMSPSVLAGSATGATPAQAVVQVVAHEDDDTLFLSPDLITQINNGVDTTTLYVTAGENAPGNTPDPSAYAAQRQVGVRSAYAAMAGVSGCDGGSAGAGGCWSASTPVFANHQVQMFTLDQRPSVRVIFLNLPENADTRFLGGGALTKLWGDPTLTTDTLQMAGAPTQRYSHSDVVDVLNAVLGRYSATIVRTQDPAPDIQLRPDHQDHSVAAEFADAAEAAYSVGHPRVLLENYRDYNISALPVNLMSSQASAKVGIFEGQYMPHDSFVQYGGTFKDDYGAWEQREYTRDPRGTQWAISDGVGVHAFVVEGGSLLEWIQHTDGSWQGPVNHGNPGGPLANGIAASRNQDGRLEVFGQRTDTGDIVSLFQTGSSWAWATLGNPSSGDPAGARRTSTPAVAVNADGREQVFVRNAGGGISSRWQVQANGGWDQTWADMGGSFVQGPPAAKTTLDGRIELFAPTTGGILRWFQPTANGGFTADNAFLQTPPASGLSVATDQSGRLEVMFRQPGTANVMTIFQGSPGGGFTAPPVSLGGDGGIGAPTVVTENGRVVVAEHNGGGGISFAEQSAPDSGFGGWTDLGGLTVDEAAAVDSSSGHAELLAIGYDGKLYDNLQQASSSFTGWQLAG